MHARIGWQNLRTSEFLDEGDYLLVTGTDFENGEIDFSTCHYVEKKRYDQDKNIQIKNGSILITKDGTLGKVAYVQNLSMPATLNAGIFNIEIKDELNINRKYLYQYLKGPFLMDYVNERATGGTIKHLNQNILVNFPVEIPSKEEQKRISACLDYFDTLITLHQRKLDDLKLLKKGLLQKMFPKNGEKIPEIRFPGFTDDWEQRKLKNLAQFRRGSFPQPYGKTEWYGGKGAMPFIQVVDVLDDFCVANPTKQTISQIAQSKSIPVNEGDVIVTLQGSIGRVAIVKNKAFIDRTLLKFETFNQEIDHYFWAHLMKLKFLKEAKSAPGGTIKTITKEVLSDFDILLPVFREQEEIGTLLTNIENLITLHQRKLDNLKLLKKGLLQEMFV